MNNNRNMTITNKNDKKASMTKKQTRTATAIAS